MYKLLNGQVCLYNTKWSSLLIYEIFIIKFLNLLIMKRFWSYGLVGSLILRGGPLLFLAYTGYILWDES